MPRKGQKSGYNIPCDNCGKIFYVTKTRYNSSITHCCCNKCQIELKHKNTYQERECLICGEKFSVPQSSTKKLCSNNCQNIWQTRQTGELNPRFNSVLTKCECCGKEYYVKPYKLSGKQHNFCSNVCRQKWYAEIWSQDEEWRLQSRERAVNILHNNKGKTLTKPQIIVNEMLDELGIKYENEYQCKYYAIDNYLTDYNLMIEVNGDYWHSSPIKYQYHQLNKMQIENIRKDKSKHTYIKRYRDIEVLYLWETDILSNPNLCKKLIMEYIQKNGVLDNYHSFNFCLKNDVVCLNEHITPLYK